VTGIDMTDELLEVARNHIPAFAKALGWQPQLRFVRGYIEYLGGQQIICCAQLGQLFVLISG
jgi:hypothetical protein